MKCETCNEPTTYRACTCERVARLKAEHPSFVVRWLTEVPTLRGVATYRQRRTFHGLGARTLAEHFAHHVVAAADPESYSIEEAR